MKECATLRPLAPRLRRAARGNMRIVQPEGCNEFRTRSLRFRRRVGQCTLSRHTFLASNKSSTKVGDDRQLGDMVSACRESESNDQRERSLPFKHHSVDPSVERGSRLRSGLQSFAALAPILGDFGFGESRQSRIEPLLDQIRQGSIPQFDGIPVAPFTLRDSGVDTVPGGRFSQPHAAFQPGSRRGGAVAQ